jgi:eukaryotic-like serine/threonine-protein kinase
VLDAGETAYSVTLDLMARLAMVYRATDKLDMALPLLAKTFDRTKAMVGPDHNRTLANMNELALAYQDAGKLDLALPLYIEAFERRRAKLSPDDTSLLQSTNNLAWGYEAAEKLDLALPLYEETLKRVKPKFSHGHTITLKIMNSLARCYIGVRQPAKAEPLLRECLAMGRNSGYDEWRKFDSQSMLGAALLGQKKYAEAEPLLLAGYQGMKEREATMTRPFKIRLIESLKRLVLLYEATGNEAKAQEWRKLLTEAPKKNAD